MFAITRISITPTKGECFENNPYDKYHNDDLNKDKVFAKLSAIADMYCDITHGCLTLDAVTARIEPTEDY